MKRTEQIILQELASTKKRIKQLKEQKSALEASLISEGLIDMLVDLILGPFIHMDAVKLRNTPEYKTAAAKIKELDKIYKKLEAKSEKLNDELAKAQSEYYKNSKNIKTFKPTKSLK